MSVEITQDHVNYVHHVARQLEATSLLGRLAGADELASEGLVALWVLAEQWDEDRGVPWMGYLAHNLRRRLIDWLRSEYGRAAAPKGRTDERMVASLGTVSLDVAAEEGLVPERPSSAPSVETVVTDRESLAEVATAIRGCTERQRDALLWPLVDGDLRAVEAKWGMTRSSAAAHRYQAKARISHARRAA